MNLPPEKGTALSAETGCCSPITSDQNARGRAGEESQSHRCAPEEEGNDAEDRSGDQAGQQSEELPLAQGAEYDQQVEEEAGKQHGEESGSPRSPPEALLFAHRAAHSRSGARRAV